MMTMIKRFLLGVLAVACVSCAETTAVKLLNADDFKAEIDGKEVSLYTLKSADLTMQ